MLSSVLAFQRLLAMWLMRIASPETARTGAPPQLPLPTPVPFEFASLPVRNPGILYPGNMLTIRPDIIM